MKTLLVFAFYLISLSAIAQKQDPYPFSDSITISGLVNKQVIFSIHDLAPMPDSALGTIKILNHRGELKTTWEQVKVISLKRILEDALMSFNKPKELSSVYFVCKAMDGYTAVFSYNEMFNNTAATIFIVKAHDNINLDKMEERPILLMITNAGSAKLGMRGLKSIEIKKQ